MAHTESQSVSWVIEKHADGQWALFLRAAGEPTQCSPWYPSRAELLVAIASVAAKVTAPEPPA
jgi:uncharacterized protein YegP (UPF0339 family)